MPAILALATVLSAPPVSLFAADPIAEVKSLYATAAYEDTLALLSRIEASGEAAVRDDVDEYRALCLMALGRDRDAERAMESLVTRHPLALEQLDQRAPRFVALYKQVRTRLLPTLATAAYAAGKRDYDRGAFPEAVAQLRDALALLKSLAADKPSGLELLASGFLALAEKSIIPTPAPAPVNPVTELAGRSEGSASPTDVPAAATAPPAIATAPPVAAESLPVIATAPPVSAEAAVTEVATVVEVAEVGVPPQPAPSARVEPAQFTPVPRLYTAADTDVTAPVAIDQRLPRWVPPNEMLRRRTFSGRVQIVVGADGRVMDAEIIQPSFSLYDEQVLRATRQWRYQPATKRGYPVQYRRTVDYVISGQ